MLPSRTEILTTDNCLGDFIITEPTTHMAVKCSFFIRFWSEVKSCRVNQEACASRTVELSQQAAETLISTAHTLLFHSLELIQIISLIFCENFQFIKPPIRFSSKIRPKDIYMRTQVGVHPHCSV